MPSPQVGSAADLLNEALVLFQQCQGFVFCSESKNHLESKTCFGLLKDSD
jgi:hypothetical protein